MTILVVVEPTGQRAERRTPEGAVRVARRLLERARARGARVPFARFLVAGVLVRDRVTRTDLAFADGVCWCGRGALYAKDGVPFCCAKHEVLWREWDDDLRARTIIARFIRIYGERGRKRRFT